MARGKTNQAYKLAQCNASAREMLIKLGIKASLIPDVDSMGTWQHPIDIEPSYDRIKQKLKEMGMQRFKRTPEEYKELEDFTIWQLEQRQHKSK